MKILTAPQSGSQAGTTASRNRFGQYLRTRAVPVQPRTPKQTFNRASLTNGSSAWRTLTDAQRTAWNDYAAQISRSDALGSTYNPTGAGLFTAAVIASLDPTLTDPPTTLPTYVLQITGMTYTDPSPGPEALTADLAVTSSTNTLFVETSGPVSPGITSVAAVRSWRSLPAGATNLNRNTFAMSGTPVDLLASYKRLFPSPNSGQVIFFRFNEGFSDGVVTAIITNRSRPTFRLVIP